MKLQFEEELIEGLCINRPNRFLMNCRIGDDEFLCHTPATGRIGLFLPGGRPVLLSRAKNPERRTKYTVEAISLSKPEDPHKEWIGINQAKSNDFIAWMISTGQMDRLVKFDKEQSELHREVKIGDSRLDLRVGNTFIEIKTPLAVIEKKVPDHVPVHEEKLMAFGAERLIKHVQELTELSMDYRVVMLTVFQYIPDRGVPKYDGGGIRFEKTDQIWKAINEGAMNGLEYWEAVLSLDQSGVELVDYYRRDHDN